MQEVRAAYVVFAGRHRDEDNIDSLPAVDFDLAVCDFRPICGRDRRCGEELRRAEVVCFATRVRQMQTIRGPTHKRDLVGLDFITAQRHGDERRIRRLSRWRRHRLCYCDSGRKRERDREDVRAEIRIKLQKKLHPVLTLFTTLRSLRASEREPEEGLKRIVIGSVGASAIEIHKLEHDRGYFMFPVPCKSTCLPRARAYDVQADPCACDDVTAVGLRRIHKSRRTRCAVPRFVRQRSVLH